MSNAKLVTEARAVIWPEMSAPRRFAVGVNLQQLADHFYNTVGKTSDFSVTLVDSLFCIKTNNLPSRPSEVHEAVAYKNCFMTNEKCGRVRVG